MVLVTIPVVRAYTFEKVIIITVFTIKFIDRGFTKISVLTILSPMGFCLSETVNNRTFILGQNSMKLTFQYNSMNSSKDFLLAIFLQMMTTGRKHTTAAAPMAPATAKATVKDGFERKLSDKQDRQTT